MKIKSVSLLAYSETFESGTVSWKLQSGQTSADFSGDGKALPFPSLHGCAEFTVVAELTGGNGSVAWQHAQLFRQSLEDTEKASFEIVVELEND